jgi:ferredoxin
MIVNEQHRKDLIIIAKKMIRERHSMPLDENGPLDDNGYPTEPTETYLEYLSLMYNEKIANIATPLGVMPKMLSLSKFAKEVNMDKKELKELLSDSVESVYIINIGNQYSLPNPLLIYDAPFIIKKNYEGPDALKLAELSRKFYAEENYYKRWSTSFKGTPYMRVLAVSEEIETGNEVIPLEEVYSLIEQIDDFWVMPCPCRNRKGIQGIRDEYCKEHYPVYNCIGMGSGSQLLAKAPGNRPITREEVKVIVKNSAEQGLVLMTDNSAKFFSTLCSCCECCCSHLQGLTKLNNPRAVSKANYISSINEESCVACGTCLERCKFSAITINDIAEIDPIRCMGCGLCAVKCPSDAITMIRFEREHIPGAPVKA